MDTNLNIYNWYYITDICQFSNCYIHGGSETMVGSANGEQECARLVRKTKPDALGVTKYGYSSRNCVAEYGTKMGQTSSIRCCLFPGTTSSCWLIFMFMLIIPY